MAEGVQISGNQQAAADAVRWANNLEQNVRRDLAPFAVQLANTLAGRQPVLTGALAASASATVGPGDTGQALFTLNLGEGLDYGGWIEFGGTHGRPYVPEGRTVHPLAHENEPTFYRLAEQSTTTSIDRYPWYQAA